MDYSKILVGLSTFATQRQSFLFPGKSWRDIQGYIQVQALIQAAAAIPEMD